MPLYLDTHDHIPGLTAEAAIETHREAHGLLADSLVEVREGA